MKQMNLILCKFVVLLFCFPVFGQTFQRVDVAVGINENYGDGLFGGGVSFVDFNGDGWDDLSFATEEGKDPLFYENQGGTFSLLNGLVSNTDELKSVIWADIDNDGDKDLMLTCSYCQNHLYENTGNLVMVDITASAGLSMTSDYTFGASFSDVNGDGFLDLYLCNREGVNATNEFYLNNGDKTFTDITTSSGASDGMKLSFQGSFLDINGNNNPDLYIAEDKLVSGNALYRGNGDGTFGDISASSGDANLIIDAMCVAFADIDNDHDLDIYVTNTPSGNAMLQNNGDETFTNIAGFNGTLHNLWSWNALFADIDNDTDEDLYVCTQGFGTPDDNILYINQGNGFFFAPYPTGFLGDDGESFGGASGDLDNDGKIDFAVNQEDPDIHFLWQNTTTTTNNWIKFNLDGINSNRDGVGTWIHVFHSNKKYVKYTHAGIGYLSQDSDNWHFGLGSASMIDSVCIIWQSGIVDKLYNVSVNQKLTIIEGSTNNGTLALESPELQIRGEENTAVLSWFAPAKYEKLMLERSENGQDFSEIYSVSGNNSNHEFVDLNLKPSIQYYYRLKLKTENEIEFSKVVTIQLQKDQIRINPNPVLSELILNTNKPILAVNIFDLNGKTVACPKLQNNTLTLDHLLAGIYFLEVKLEDSFERIKFVKL